MKRLLTITAIVAIGALTACNPLEPITPANRVVELDIPEGGVVAVDEPGEGGECAGGACPTETVVGVASDVCDTPGVGGCPGGEPPVTGVATEPVCEVGGVTLPTEGGRDCG